MTTAPHVQRVIVDLLREGYTVAQVRGETGVSHNAIRRIAAVNGVKPKPKAVKAPPPPPEWCGHLQLRTRTAPVREVWLALCHAVYCLEADCDECMRIEEMLEDSDFVGYRPSKRAS